MRQAIINAFNAAGEAAGLRINISKTKTLVFGSEITEEKMKVGDKQLENVTEFDYLGSLISWDNDCGKEIRRRIAKALGANCRVQEGMDRRVKNSVSKHKSVF